MTRLGKLRFALARVRRFAPAAVRSLRGDARFVMRSAWSAVRFPALRSAGANIRRAWRRSDPAWRDRAQYGRLEG